MSLVQSMPARQLGKSETLRRWVYAYEWLKGERYRVAFVAIKDVVKKAYMRRPKTKLVEPVKPEDVKSVACALEAVMVMAENIEPDEMLTVCVTNAELGSFVNYMRILDKEYRFLAAQVEDLKEKLARGPKADETVAATGKAYYRKLTREETGGAVAGQAGRIPAGGPAKSGRQISGAARASAKASPLILGGERPEVFQGDVPMAEGPVKDRRIGRVTGFRAVIGAMKMEDWDNE